MTSLPNPSCQLLDLVIRFDWDNVIEHCKVHPEDASFQDGDNLETPLYLACQYSPPPEVIDALINSYPTAVNISSRRERDIPIHTACRYGASVEILEKLLKNHPETSLAETRWGKTPISLLVDNACNWRASQEEEYDEVSEEKLWRRVQVVLSAVARLKNLRSKNDHKDLLLLHAAVSSGSYACPRKALDMVIKQYPAQVYAVDEHGRLPLHIVLRRTEWSIKLRRRYKPREKYAIETLLSLYPQAAKIPWDGRYPLQMAVANGHVWHYGVDFLFTAYPEANFFYDPKTNLLPFQNAAIPVGESQPSVDTIFHLLLNAPHILNQYI